MYNKDRVAGALFLLLGVLGLWFGRALPFGGLQQIGSGFLPRITFASLLVIGLVKIVASRFTDTGSISVAIPKAFGYIAVAFILFGLCIERLGLVIAIVAMLAAVEAAGKHKKTVKSFALLAIGLIVFSIAVFRFVLGIPLEVLPKWM
jgi:hypothetical protein